MANEHVIVDLASDSRDYDPTQTLNILYISLSFLNECVAASIVGCLLTKIVGAVIAIWLRNASSIRDCVSTNRRTESDVSIFLSSVDDC